MGKYATLAKQIVDAIEEMVVLLEKEDTDTEGISSYFKRELLDYIQCNEGFADVAYDMFAMASACDVT